MDNLHVLPEGSNTSDVLPEGSDTSVGLPDSGDHGHTWTPPEDKVGTISTHIAALRSTSTDCLGEPPMYLLCETVTVSCSRGNQNVILLYDTGASASLTNSSFECCNITPNKKTDLICYEKYNGERSIPSYHNIITLELEPTKMRVVCSQVPTLSKPFSVRCNYKATSCIVGENLDHLPTIIESLHFDRIYVGMDNGMLMPQRLHEHEIPPHLRHLKYFGIVVHRSEVTKKLLYCGGYKSSTMVDCTELPILLVKNKKEVRGQQKEEESVLPPDEVRSETEEDNLSPPTSPPTSPSLAIVDTTLDGGKHPDGQGEKEDQVDKLSPPASLTSTPAPPLHQLGRQEVLQHLCSLQSVDHREGGDALCGVEDLDDAPEAMDGRQEAGHVVEGGVRPAGPTHGTAQHNPHITD